MSERKAAIPGQKSPAEGSSAPARRAGDRELAAKADASGAIEQGLRAPAKPLDKETRSFFEQRFGHDFASVRVHAGARAAASADALNAKAYTAGSDIVFGAGRYQPNTRHGSELLAHELAHVAQQPGGTWAGGSVRLSSPDSPAEHAAATNARRVVAGLAPANVGVAEPGMVYRTIKDDLSKAVAGWGTDEEAIFTRLQAATPDEKTAVLADPLLMQDLYDDLSRSDWSRVLRLLGAAAESKINAASEGWGTDEDAIFDALRDTAATELKRQIETTTILLTLRDELSDDDLGQALAIVAEKYAKEPSISWESTFHVLVLFPDAIPQACKYLTNLGVNVATGVIGFLQRGHLMAPATVSDINTFIENDNLVTRVEAAFEARWNLDLRTRKSATGKVPNWTVNQIRNVHRSLQQLPPGHVVRPAQMVPGIQAGEVAAFELDALKPHMGFWDASRGTILVGEEFGDIAGLTRHEVGHAMDSFLAGTTTTFKQNAVNGWRWSNSSATWETAMASPWARKDGSVVPVADQGAIRTHLDAYITTDGSAGLRDGTPANHAIRKYWNDDVPMIEAAKGLAGRKDKVWNAPGSIKKIGARYYSWSAYYHEFYVYNAVVQDKRLTDYQLFGHPEFFADMYEAYYEEGTGPTRGDKLKGVPNWKQFFDGTVHTAVQT
ncbi:DUF4157 domain-containing protein [Variovorax sp. J22R24]|uniref:eCIS core domain-containing protein n=1 Tax=Variovorax gracilis TaxID=3053502 RepID=UPI002575604C|nr:DUF4157 domain-containing protein [Variovorax sp. J22R24]MDM0109285.1 DUF4157 domain-containing protein [Variovorax sp. J22R24]